MTAIVVDHEGKREERQLTTPKEAAADEKEFSYQEHYNALMSGGNGVNHSTYNVSQGNYPHSVSKEVLDLGDSHL